MIESSPSAPQAWLGYLAPAIATVIFCSALYVLHHEFSTLKLEAVIVQLRAVPTSKLALALLLTALSYFALTNYDRLAIAYVGRSLPIREVMAISFTAFAVGHNVGVATLSGGSIRYRAYSNAGLTAIEIAEIIGFCAATFLVGASVLLGFSLILEPEAMLARLGIPLFILKNAGYALAAIPVIYLVCSRYLVKPFRIRNWTLTWPTTTICAQQIVFACLDLTLAAGVLYALLPEALGISYPHVLGAYLIAVGLGVVSSVPGGLGVIEGMLLLLLPQIPQATLLGAVLGYRVIDYLIPLLVALLLLALQELKVHRQRLVESTAATGLWISRIAPQVLGATVFLAGAALVFSQVFPPVATRFSAVEQFIPLPLFEASNILSSAVGVALLIVARFI